MEMKLNIYQVDSFCTQPFKGNPAGVCFSETALSETLMKHIAAEMAVSETAFLSLDDWCLRWFTPETEVKLCGHGTLAVMHILQQKGMIATGEQVRFQTLSGTLTAQVREENIEMDFPAPDIDFSSPADPLLFETLGINDSQVISYGIFDTKQLIVVNSEQLVQSLTSDFSALARMNGRGVVVTAVASGTEENDIVSRYFAPWVGVNEDPVTGSAHCALAVYWTEKLNLKEIKACQLSARGGRMTIRLTGDNRVIIAGNAVTVIEGTLQC